MGKAFKLGLRFFYFITTLMLLPLLLLFCFFYRNEVKKDLMMNLSDISNVSLNNVSVLKKALIVAEDHRFNYHYGFDVIAILRAAVNFFYKKKLEGASTIQQQLIRTMSGRYEITLKRKIIEITASYCLTIIKSKSYISEKYICVAYYGTNLSSAEEALLKLSKIYGLSFDDDALYFALIASLKYPIPLTVNEKWICKHKKRIEHIISLLSS